jgi:hypothetical protein
MTDIPANTPRPIGRTESDFPGISNEAGPDSELSAAARVSEAVDEAEVDEDGSVVEVGLWLDDGKVVAAEIGMDDVPMTVTGGEPAVCVTSDEDVIVAEPWLDGGEIVASETGMEDVPVTCEELGGN